VVYRCLWFFLEPIAVKGDNYGFLRKLLEHIKMTVDAQDPTNSESNKNIYAACDLAMGVLLSKVRKMITKL
jgi:sister-chromatid-cohesion protein PDS5